MEQMIEQCIGMMQMMGGRGMMSGGMMGMPGMMGGMLLGAVVVAALLIAGVVSLIRRLGSRASNSVSAANAILEERYARGEIGLEEYQERRSVLLNRA